MIWINRVPEFITGSSLEYLKISSLVVSYDMMITWAVYAKIGTITPVELLPLS